MEVIELSCNRNYDCKECKYNLIYTKQTANMKQNVDYSITLISNDNMIGSKDYYWYMDRYGDIKGVCEVNKCMD